MFYTLLYVRKKSEMGMRVQSPEPSTTQAVTDGQFLLGRQLYLRRSGIWRGTQRAPLRYDRAFMSMLQAFFPLNPEQPHTQAAKTAQTG